MKFAARTTQTDPDLDFTSRLLTRVRGIPVKFAARTTQTDPDLEGTTFQHTWMSMTPSKTIHYFTITKILSIITMYYVFKLFSDRYKDMT